MTAPYKRNDGTDLSAIHHRRIRTLEANRGDGDTTGFLLNYSVLCPQIVSVGGTDPSALSTAGEGFVLSNFIVQAKVSVQGFGGFSAGTGSQYLLPLGQFDFDTYWNVYPYAPRFFGIPELLGIGVCYDQSANLYQNMNMRLSTIDYNGDGGQSVFLEAYDPITGSLWGPTYPFTWTNLDTMLSGWITYPLSYSLIDTVGG